MISIMNKKGFTLVELISVLVLLVLLFLFAITTVRKHMDSSEKKATRASALSFINTVSGYASVNNNDPDQDKIAGFYDVNTLYGFTFCLF